MVTFLKTQNMMMQKMNRLFLKLELQILKQALKMQLLLMKAKSAMIEYI